MDDKRLDELLGEAVGSAPPEDVVRAVSPWQHAMNQVLWGLALTSISLNFLLLNYILPSMGAALMLLGFRTLRANRHFCLSYYAAMLRCAVQIASLFLGATVIPSETLSAVLIVISALATFGITLGFWHGLLEARAAAGLEPRASAAGWLIVWYAVIYVLALVSLAAGGSLNIMGILLIAAFIAIIVSLVKLSKQLDEAGYAVKTAPVRLTDRRLCVLLALIAAAAITLGLTCFSRYDMDWELRPERGEKAAAVAEELLALGFPDHVLADLSDSDVLLCEDAAQVLSSTDTLSFRDGSELLTTGVAVLLPEFDGWEDYWLIFHHFEWQEDARLHGTDSAELWATSGWMLDHKNPAHGRLLYSEDGVTYTAPPAEFVQSLDYQYTGGFGFSFPRSAAEARGYLCYGLIRTSDDYVHLNSWLNYQHQTRALMYPVSTSLETQSGVFLGSGLIVPNSGSDFQLGQCALSLSFGEDGAEVGK